MEITRLIKIASSAYSRDGEVFAYHKHPEGNFGDGLAKFIAIELLETFDETASDDDQLFTAAEVMRISNNELEKVMDAFEDVRSAK